MPRISFNVRFNGDLADFLEAEVVHGGFSNASEAVRHAIREWRERKIAEDLAGLQAAHEGAYERDTTDEELAAILAAQKRTREKRLLTQAKVERGIRRLPAKPVSAATRQKEPAP